MDRGSTCREIDGDDILMRDCMDEAYDEFHRSRKSDLSKDSSRLEDNDGRNKYRAEEEEICLKCGDKGWSVALIYCEKCQIYVVHRYCLDVLPSTFDEDVIWYCDDCEPEQAKPSIIDIGCLSVEAIRSRKESNKRNGTRSKARKNNRSKTRKKKKKRNVITDLVTIPECEQKHTLEVVLDCNENYNNDQKLQSDEDDDSVKTITSKIVEVYDIMHDVPIEAQPIIDPIWRGGFSLCHKSFTNLGGLVAHLSSFACLKVSEEANLLPELLNMDILPRLDVWPKNFLGSGPTDKSIAIYLFPGEESAEKAFDCLVDEMILQDLAMSAAVENAELLVFPSNQLPIQHWRFQAKYYLWGVFRRKQAWQRLKEGTREDKDLSKAITCTRSPVSTLSNSGSCGAGPPPSAQSSF